MKTVNIYGLIGIFILVYSIIYSSIRYIVIKDFSKREFKNNDLKIKWRKRIYNFTMSQIGVIAYFIHFIIKNEKN